MGAELAGELPSLPTGGSDAVLEWTREHLGDLSAEGRDAMAASPRFRGGQTEADLRLAQLDIRGYAARRNQVHPASARGATELSPYVRHGLIALRRLWDRVADAPARDRAKYRDELLWQEYARHLYARVGQATARPLRYAPTQAPSRWPMPWPQEMACMASTVGELERDGWLVNQSRMWLSSQWSVRAGHGFSAGEDHFFTHLLDGSRAANRLGWQWTVGAGTGRPYGFSRWQVQKRAPQLCADCQLSRSCPIQEWPDTAQGARLESPDPRLKRDPAPAVTAGPDQVEARGDPQLVWLTAESLGDEDPALAAHPSLPAVFVFDEPLLGTLRLSGKRLTFLAETLADLSGRRELHVLRGAPVSLLSSEALATTFAPVPGFRRRAGALRIASLHPWPWLSRPTPGTVTSFSAWRASTHVDEQPALFP